MRNGITNAVDQQIRQAQARHSNFENGMSNHGDTSATDGFERIRAQLEFESARVRCAMERAVEQRRVQAILQSRLDKENA